MTLYYKSYLKFLSVAYSLGKQNEYLISKWQHNLLFVTTSSWIEYLQNYSKLLARQQDTSVQVIFELMNTATNAH